MIEQLTGLAPHTIGFKMSGKLHDEDYKTFVPLVDAAGFFLGAPPRALVNSKKSGIAWSSGKCVCCINDPRRSLKRWWQSLQ